MIGLPYVFKVNTDPCHCWRLAGPGDRIGPSFYLVRNTRAGQARWYVETSSIVEKATNDRVYCDSLKEVHAELIAWKLVNGI